MPNVHWDRFAFGDEPGRVWALRIARTLQRRTNHVCHVAVPHASRTTQP